MSDAMVEQRRFRFTFELELAPREAPARVWVPVPIADAHQELLGRAPPPGFELLDGVDPRSSTRTICLTVPASAAATRFEVSYEVRRHLRRRAAPAEAPWSAPPSADPGLARYLAANRSVPLDGPIAAMAAEVGERGQPAIRLARRAFDHLLQTLSYDAGGCTPERADKLGDLHAACDLRTGTCTEFHGLFVGTMRALAVPARFNFGFNVPRGQRQGRIRGYHCWSEIALPDGTWFAVDVSEAWKRPELRSFYFGSLDADRVAFTWDRDVTLEPPQQAGPIDKFIFPYAEAAGRELKPELGFRFEEL